MNYLGHFKLILNFNFKFCTARFILNKTYKTYKSYSCYMSLMRLLPISGRIIVIAKQAQSKLKTAENVRNYNGRTSMSE